MKKKIMDFILAFILFYAGILALLYFGQRSMMYFPGGVREKVSTLTDYPAEFIPVTSEGDITFNAWHWPAKPNMPTLVFFHGNGQAYPYWVSKMMVYHDLGYGVFFADYRGYGGVKGKPTEQGIYNDARAHLKTFTAQTGIKTSALIYYGESLGTGVAIQMATEHPPKALILESPYSTIPDVAKSRYWMFPVERLMKDQFRSIDKINALTMPKFFIHGKKDMVVPLRFGQRLYAAAPEPKQQKIIENSGHNDLYDHGAQLHISRFLSTL